MKKALVVLLLLAFVGGGLFAQFTVSGRVNTGLGALKIGDGDLGFGLIAKDHWVDGMRTDINVNLDNSDNTVGFRGRIRAVGAPTSSTAWNASTQIRRAFGFVKGMGGLLEVQGGRIDDTQIGAVDGLLGWGLYDSYGLLAYVNPTDIVKIGVGAHSNYVISATTPWDANGLVGWAGLRVNLDIVKVAAQFRVSKADTRAYASAGFNAGPAAIGVGGFFIGLTDFADAGIMYFTASARLNILEGLGLWLGGIFGMNNAASDPFMGFGAEVDYTIAGVRPRLNVAYISGNAYGYGSGLNWWANFDTTPTWNANQSYLTVNPAVWFAGNRIEVGAVVNLDMGSVSSNPGFGAYVNYNVAF